ncbi:MAG: hypothetical protein ACP5N5_05080 [Desulfurococcus sp.]|uniref:hypothetical protein n=1 Tax=Desulfurococcus sp. TaxID=51678 RepID=UPI003D0976F7
MPAELKGTVVVGGEERSVEDFFGEVARILCVIPLKDGYSEGRYIVAIVNTGCPEDRVETESCEERESIEFWLFEQIG